MTGHDTDPRHDDELDASIENDTHAGREGGWRSRRGFLKTTGALGIAGLLGTSGDAVGRTRAASTGGAGDPWTVVAIPDTQNMDDDDTVEYADSITDWVVDNVDQRNIAFVTHEGDMVSNGDDERELQNIDDVMSDLDGVVPWSPCVGNHDLMDTMYRNSGAEMFKEYFGASRFEGLDYFGGVSDNGRNFYQYFSAGGYDFLHLSLEWEAPGDPLDPGTPLGWAQSVLDDHPKKPTILTTHSYLGDYPREHKRDVEEANGWGTSGKEMWEKFVRPNPQIFMVLNGHNHDLDGNDQGEYHQVSTNVAGESVYEMLANYQDYPNGGDGWFRRIRFEPGGGSDAPDRIQVRTYTAYHDEYQTSDRSEFGFDLDFDSRFAVSGGGGDRERVRFQEDVDGYAGTVDTQLHEGNSDTTYGDASSVNVDGADDGGEVHGLLRFDDVVGSADGQVPAGATVNAATLSVESTNPGDGATLHRMRTAWSDADAWSDWGGIDADGTDAVASADATVSGPDTGTIIVDVTESVQAWVDGDPNHGWGLLPTGDNGWDFDSAAGANPPELSVIFEDGDGDDGGDDDDPSEGLHAIDDSTVEAIWRPDVAIEWPDFVYFGASVDGEPRQWQRMDETSDGVFEATLGALASGDTIDYQFTYWADGSWQHVEGGTYTFQPDDDDGDGAESGPGTSRLVHGKGDELTPGDHLESKNGDYRLEFQASDGNLVLYTDTGEAPWASNTYRDGGTLLTLQGDGNLVMYTDGGDAVWASGTYGSGADVLVLEDDGSLSLYAGDTEVWTVNG